MVLKGGCTPWPFRWVPRVSKREILRVEPGSPQAACVSLIADGVWDQVNHYPVLFQPHLITNVPCSAALLPVHRLVRAAEVVLAIEVNNEKSILARRSQQADFQFLSTAENAGKTGRPSKPPRHGGKNPQVVRRAQGSVSLHPMMAHPASGRHWGAGS
jgi:hypothetical protein